MAESKRLRNIDLDGSHYLDVDGSWYSVEDRAEEAVLAIGSASSATQFCDTVLKAMHLHLFNVKHALVFLLDPDSQELMQACSDAHFEPLPKSGVLWDSVRCRSTSIIRSSDCIKEDDPLWTLLPEFKHLEEDHQVVLINPVVDKVDHAVLALMMAVSDDPTMIQLEKMRWMQRNALVAAMRVVKEMAVDKGRIRAESMLHVCSDLIDLDTTSLTIKILKHIKTVLNVKMSYLFIVDDNTQELVCLSHNDVVLEKEWRIELNPESIYGRCFMNGEALILEDISKDVRFNPTTDIHGYEPSTMMCLPIKTRNNVSAQQILGVAVACDKINGEIFLKRDHDNMEFVLKFCSSVIANTLAYQRELALKKQNQTLLQVARNLFSRLGDLNTLLSEIMNEARSLTNAERCSMFLLDASKQELVATVFDCDLPTDLDTIRIKVGQGIAGRVAQTAQFVNIKDVYKNPQFFKEVDKNTGFRTRNMLCFPIKDHNGEVVGVAELVNKVDGNFFTKYDEELCSTFSVYCGISLYQSKLYKKMKESRGRSKLATELMIYHMQVTSDDVDRLASTPIPACTSYDQIFSSFSYSPRAIAEDSDTVMAVISMMNEMNLIHPWKIERNTLAKFVLMVKKGYRDPAYHNWKHALSVTHFSYLLYQHCDQLPVLKDLELLALFISCLTHDIDHRGTNNAFQVSSNSTLASLYSSAGSVMERHHFAQTVCILNSESCNILENITHDNYKLVLDLIQHNILSTDITHHLRSMNNIEEMATNGYQLSSSYHRKLMCSLMMTCCDLSSTCKEWKWSKKVSDLIYTEFFTQGDLERNLGQTPIEMMDRNRARIPEQQLDFLDSIAGPTYRLLAKLLPPTASACENLQANRKEWEVLARGRDYDT